MTFLDGGFGTMIQAAGLPAGKDPTDWNIENPEAVQSVHKAYVAAGSDIVLTNTFGANRLKYHGSHDLGELVRAAIANARASGAKKVALDIGPTGKLLKPAGDLDFEDAYSAFAELVREGVGRRCGSTADDKDPNNTTVDLDLISRPDLVFIETMGDTREIKAAVLAAKENCDLPVYVSVALGEDGKLLTGASVECVAAMLEGLGVDAYGFNCGLGPDMMLPYVERLAKVTTKPIIVKPNAGMPRLTDGKTVFDVGPEEFAKHVKSLVEAGATIVGGCCGTTPGHIVSVRSLELGVRSDGLKLLLPDLISSGATVVELKSHEGLIIGERINPTGKKKLKEAYARGDQAYVLREAVTQVDAGAKVLDVNCGVPGIDEAATLDRTIGAVEGVVTCPLQIDTADPKALEIALRHVNGKALVNSVNGKRESMDAVFPLVKKYGGMIVGLCLDESGIPATSDGRIAIAEKIIAEGAKYGFAKKDFVFDALTLAVSADADAAKVTLETVKRLTDELGVNTVLGVSNVSFGLPNRPVLNNTMYALAKRAGLSAAIANPSVIRDEIDPAAEDVLLGRDPGCLKWIEICARADSSQKQLLGEPSANTPYPLARSSALSSAIIHGLKADAFSAAEELLKTTEPVEVIEKGIVPALEEVGRGFEKGTIFLPQLLMSADAAGEAFSAVKRILSRASTSTSTSVSKSPIIIATVKGDIHDIGKNIVRVLLENYGFDVVDLGRDVPPEEIVAAAVKNGSKLVGLSALMTTTVGAMAETVRQLKEADPSISTFVGGAVVTDEYARSIGATYYTKDAMASVRLAKSFFNRG